MIDTESKIIYGPGDLNKGNPFDIVNPDTQMSVADDVSKHYLESNSQMNYEEDFPSAKALNIRRTSQKDSRNEELMGIHSNKSSYSLFPSAYNKQTLASPTAYTTSQAFRTGITGNDPTALVPVPEAAEIR